MITLNHAHAGLVASGVFVLGLFCVGGTAVTQAAPLPTKSCWSTARPAGA